MEPTNKRNFAPVRALERGLALLQDLSLYKGAHPQQIARRLELPRPTVVRLLETLEGLGFVERSPSDGSWYPTLYVRSLSDGYNDEAWVRECAAPEIERLGKQILWPVDLHTLQNDMMLVRESTHRTSPFSIQHGLVGTRLPILHTSSGRAYLAFCPDEEREAILDRLAQNPANQAALAGDRRHITQQIAITRQQGYGLRSGELIRATNSLSVPVHAKGRVQAVVTVVWFVSALPVAEGVRHFLEPARECAARIAQKCEAFPDMTMRYRRENSDPAE
ncbi:IclR family transcriptional regulator domain-containing protein [Brucella inopinata]|uniref:IclR family transcriptional regulator C-terminal domain-containing protein n=1 Tax=Brucella inopinata TaxID=1218315 RepID=A0AAW7B7W9_9HYPH|nr:IclR family transcriptional regulator C-terminal domain-containing protein [Brucella inopinata]MDL2334391.1 IclR family transcriptional regulator C-terminal domain-containing protein [Brucella inopinata]